MIREISNIEQKEIIKGFKGRFFHTNSFTIAFWDIEEGSILPEHSHIHEQSTQVIEGKLELVIDAISTILEPGMIANIPSNVIHSGKALTNCKVTDIFSPTREDYK
ncbi:MAG: cupin domain-containing protein [Lutibacter sp.]